MTMLKGTAKPHSAEYAFGYSALRGLLNGCYAGYAGLHLLNIVLLEYRREYNFPPSLFKVRCLMLSKRLSVQKAHERFVVDEFLRHFNRWHNTDFCVIDDTCDRPEAIIENSHGTARWVEVTGAYWNRGYAEDLWSHATPSEAHKPMRRGLFVDMTSQFAANLAQVIKKKLEKTSYRQIRDCYGAGYLVVSIQFPWCGDDDWPYIQQEWRKQVVDDLGCFRAVFLLYRVFDGYKLRRWLLPVNQAKDIR
jgi:hypothetical protein